MIMQKNKGGNFASMMELNLHWMVGEWPKSSVQWSLQYELSLSHKEKHTLLCFIGGTVTNKGAESWYMILLKHKVFAVDNTGIAFSPKMNDQFQYSSLGWPPGVDFGPCRPCLKEERDKGMIRVFCEIHPTIINTFIIVPAYFPGNT